MGGENKVLLIPLTVTPWKVISTEIENGIEWHCPECGWRKRWTKDGQMISLAKGNPTHAHRAMPILNGKTSGGGGISKRARKMNRAQTVITRPTQPEIQIPETPPQARA
jgi:hypothetical protein